MRCVIVDGDGFSYAPPCFPFRYDAERSWLKQGNEIVKDPVGDIFIKDAGVTELEKIVFQRFQLDTAFVGHVTDGDGSKIRQSGYRAD